MVNRMEASSITGKILRSNEEWGKLNHIHEDITFGKNLNCVTHI